MKLFNSSPILIVFISCTIICIFQDCAEFFRDTRCGLVVDTVFVTSNTIWKKSDGPQSYKARVIVSKSATLTIEPGVAVSFDILTDQDDILKTGYCMNEDYLLGIIVRGKLVVKGQVNDSVFFSSKNSQKSWAGIRVENGASLDMQCAVMSNAGITSYHSGKIEIRKSSIGWCSFQATDSVVLINNRMQSVSCDSCKEVGVFNNIFKYIDSDFRYSNAQIKNNLFIQKETYQKHNWMLNLLRKKGDGYRVIVENNIIIGDTISMIIWDYPASVLKFNCLFFNILYFSQLFPVDTIYHDTDNTYSGFGIGSRNKDSVLVDTYFNIISDPFFKDSTFALSDSSKCRNNGNPDIANNDTDGTRNDIGISGGKYPWKFQ
jgi:hypothetical protein